MPHDFCQKKTWDQQIGIYWHLLAFIGIWDWDIFWVHDEQRSLGTIIFEIQIMKKKWFSGILMGLMTDYDDGHQKIDMITIICLMNWDHSEIIMICG